MKKKVSKAGGELTTEQLGGMNTNCSVVVPEPEPEVKEEKKEEEVMMMRMSRR